MEICCVRALWQSEGVEGRDYIVMVVGDGLETTWIGSKAASHDSTGCPSTCLQREGIAGADVPDWLRCDLHC